MTNAGLVHLEGLSHLKFSGDWGVALTDAGLVHLRVWPSSEALAGREPRGDATGSCICEA